MLTTFCNIIVALYCLYLCVQIKHYVELDFCDYEFYELPFVVSTNIFAHVIGLLAIWNNSRHFFYALDCLDHSENYSWSIVIDATLALAFGLIFFIYVIAFFEEKNHRPSYILFRNYNNTKSDSCISYSVFQSMYQMHPEYFTLTRTTFAYHDSRFHLNFVDYIRACCLISVSEENHHTNNANKIYQQMQYDLQKDRAELQAKNEAALQQMQELINNSQN